MRAEVVVTLKRRWDVPEDAPDPAVAFGLTVIMIWRSANERDAGLSPRLIDPKYIGEKWATEYRELAALASSEIVQHEHRPAGAYLLMLIMRARQSDGRLVAPAQEYRRVDGSLDLERAVTDHGRAAGKHRDLRAEQRLRLAAMNAERRLARAPCRMHRRDGVQHRRRQERRPRRRRGIASRARARAPSRSRSDPPAPPRPRPRREVLA